MRSTGLNHNALAWWSAKDNKALLYAYWERGLNLYNYLDKSHMVFAEQLMLDYNSTVDFTIKVRSNFFQLAKQLTMNNVTSPFFCYSYG